MSGDKAIVDPTIWTNVNYYQGFDCYIQRSLPNTSECAEFSNPGNTDFVGYDGTNLDRGLEYFAVQWDYTHIVPNANILDAELDLNLASSSSSSAVPVTALTRVEVASIARCRVTGLIAVDRTKIANMHAANANARRRSAITATAMTSGGSSAFLPAVAKAAPLASARTLRPLSPRYPR